MFHKRLNPTFGITVSSKGNFRIALQPLIKYYPSGDKSNDLSCLYNNF